MCLNGHRDCENGDDVVHYRIHDQRSNINLIWLNSKINAVLNFFFLLSAKVPFPLTIRFKAMLQRGIDLASLNASWYVSYFKYCSGNINCL
jgi:hypothetical protein